MNERQRKAYFAQREKTKQNNRKKEQVKQRALGASAALGGVYTGGLAKKVYTRSLRNRKYRQATAEYDAKLASGVLDQPQPHTFADRRISDRRTPGKPRLSLRLWKSLPDDFRAKIRAKTARIAVNNPETTAEALGWAYGTQTNTGKRYPLEREYKLRDVVSTYFRESKKLRDIRKTARMGVKEAAEEMARRQKLSKLAVPLKRVAKRAAVFFT